MKKIFTLFTVFEILTVNNAGANSGCVAVPALIDVLQTTENINADDFVAAYQTSPLQENECLLVGGVEAYCEMATQDMAQSDAEKACAGFKQEVIQQHNQYVKNQPKLNSGLEKTYGCPGGNNIAATISRCEKTQTDAQELSRCKKCVNNAGTYENGKCYVEIIGWACLGKGWNPKSKTNPAPCSESNKYQDCHIVRKYIDVEQPFVCDVAEFMPGKTAALSGCGQHGWSAGDKHPPMNISNDNKQSDCSLPLKLNNGWRSAYKKGTAIGINYKGKSVVTANWCMPSASAGPWNNSNHTGSAKHLRESSLMSGGESKDKWLSLD